jgi:hypothetical protein
MAQDWYIEGVEFSNCNCDYGCPCQFESRRPTQGYCRGFATVVIDRGHFGDVPLDGLGGALLYAWPGPIFEGNGESAPDRRRGPYGKPTVEHSRRDHRYLQL